MTTARYDRPIHIDPVTAPDAGVYTCVDDAGLGPRASATLSVLHPTSASQSSPSASLTSCGSGLATSQLPVANHTEGTCVAYTQDCQQAEIFCPHIMWSRVYATVGCPSVRLSVCPSVLSIIRSLRFAASGLLLWARHAGDIDRLLHGWRSAAAAPQHGAQQRMRAVSRCQRT